MMINTNHVKIQNVSVDVIMSKQIRPEKELVHVGLHYDSTLGYTHSSGCLNCRWFGSIYIPYGVTIKEYLKNKRCERCNCEGVLY